MLKFLLIGICVCCAQMCSGELDIKSIPNPNGWSGLTDTNIEQYRNLFESIRGISSQTVNDLIDVITKFRQNFTVPIFIEKIVDHVLINGLKANTSIVHVNDVEHFFGEEGEPSDGTPEILNQFDKILSEKLDPDEKNRVMTFIRGFQLGTTSGEIKAALSYLYGSSAISASNIHSGSYLICVICYLAYCCQLLSF